MKAALDSQAQAEALSQEMQIREELKSTLEKEQHSFKQERESLFIQVDWLVELSIYILTNVDRDGALAMSYNIYRCSEV